MYSWCLVYNVTYWLTDGFNVRDTMNFLQTPEHPFLHQPLHLCRVLTPRVRYTSSARPCKRSSGVHARDFRAYIQCILNTLYIRLYQYTNICPQFITLLESCIRSPWCHKLFLGGLLQSLTVFYIHILHVIAYHRNLMRYKLQFTGVHNRVYNDTVKCYGFSRIITTVLFIL